VISFREFLFYSEKLCQDADGKNDAKGNPYIIGSILNSWIAIEFFINNMMQDFASLPEDLFTLHEKGILEEREVQFTTEGDNGGTFQLSNRVKFWRLEDKIMFLIARFGKSKAVDKGTTLWQRFERMKEKRNSLTHPRRGKEVTLILEDAQEAIEVSKEIITLVSSEVWRKTPKW
jgi:hypothetical protein